MGLSRILVLLATVTMVLGACPSPADPGPSDAAGSGDQGDTNPALGDPCVGSNDCSGQVCDKRHGACVDCYLDRHCASGMICASGGCMAASECGEDVECTDGLVCDSAGACVQCAENQDCEAGAECVEAVCRPAFPDCTSFQDCASLGAVCDEDANKCESCTDQSQCGIHEYCLGGECVPAPCVAGEPLCDGAAVLVCRESGDGWSQTTCPEKHTCFSGACVLDECEPGTTVCEKYQVKVCTPTGQIVATNCPIGEECREGSCAPMRHRVLVVFDTSGSMDHFPGSNDWPAACAPGETEGCYGTYPTCETDENPFTILGFSKRVFGQFFGDAKDVVFALQRFPQTANRASPACNGGYFTGATEMTGDNGTKATVLDQVSWFDVALSEILLVPFPTGAETDNAPALSKWMDFSEWLVDTGKACTGPGDCPGGVCLGAVGNQSCRAMANPEIWAHGWTPLGKSLFYAGEYLRREVVIDGKPCDSDADCASPGYFCGETGLCFDPLRHCRLNVIVMFTDGGETEHPFTNDFFNPEVQAKRLRYGLGCSTDADCSALDYCVRDVENLEWYGCHAVRCENAESGAGYCTNDVIEGDTASPVILREPGFDRLRDYAGNPIEVVVNVVDASVTAPDINPETLGGNRRVALNGGGLHVIVAADDSPDFLAQLRKTIDFKSLFQLCIQQ